MGDFFTLTAGALGGSWLALNFMTVVKAAAMALVGAIVINMLMKIIDRMLDKSKGLASLRVYVRSAANAGLWFLVILMILPTFGIDVTSVLALFGVAGLAVSLALQNTLSNLAGGIQILISKPFVVGDYIDTEKGSGTVTEIGLAYSKLLTVDNRALLIPNNMISNSKIENFTSTGKRRVDISFTAAYDSPIEAVKKATMEVIGMNREIVSDPAAPVVLVTNYGASSIEYVIRAWVETSDYWTVYFNIMDNLLPTFTKHGVEMSYDHLNVHVVSK